MVSGTRATVKRASYIKKSRRSGSRGGSRLGLGRFRAGFERLDDPSEVIDEARGLFVGHRVQILKEIVLVLPVERHAFEKAAKGFLGSIGHAALLFAAA